MRIILWILRAIVALLIVVTVIPAVAALLGFVVPIFDVLNHFQMLIILATLVAFVLALVIRMRREWIAIAALGLVTSAITFVPVFASSLMPRPAVTDAPVVKLMTHNIFGLNRDMKRVASIIAAEDPDIVALQEYFPQQSELDTLLKPTYPYSVRCLGGKRANLGLYSKIPFDREMTQADCPSDPKDTQRTAHIIAGFALSDGTRFSVMTTHMDWPYPIDRQRDEFEAAEAAINLVKGPLLVVGDFNSTPWSYAMKGFEAASGLTNQSLGVLTYPTEFTASRRYIPGGYLRGLIPFLPLDQVFERGIAVTELHRGPDTGSDHLPVIFSFAVAKS